MFRLIFVSACLLCLASTAPADSTRVYRCTGEQGQVEFRQGPCEQGRQQELEIQHEKTGWDAPPAKLEIKVQSHEETEKKRPSSRQERKTKEKCLKTKHKLEDVNSRLRQGHKGSRTAALRRKQAQYEEYLREFCD